ncbi:mucoidy inhibitor MuiA family protein [Marivirga sp.]|uniref:mucoidy inhibitor MuiA family protein n=1 Tax=Marivirga sp. TaxID=2018662 RepID=UPI002D8078AC|nr:mucoidy inhibitor MuiA family protein [Marivirga sp.]HET8859154.1 mucoidy inhibitor MuiA family protein [Marivirga sp.]
MKNLLLGLFLVFSFPNLFAQSGSIEKELPTETSQVTVYLQGAQVQREGTINLGSGNYTLTIKSLSALLDPNSINVKGTGDIKILSVQHQFDYLEKETNSLLVDSIEFAIEKIEADLNSLTNRMDILNAKESLIASNKNLGTENVTSIQLLEMLKLYEKELTSIKKEQTSLNQEITRLRSQLDKLNSQLNAVNRDKSETKSKILIKLESNQNTKASFEISYFVEGAGWYPKYRLNVSDITKPIDLEYQAEVFQQTGEDWNDVKLRFSNAEPNQNKQAPELETWYLDYARFTDFEENNPANLRLNNNSVKGKVVDAESGEAIPGVNVLVKGTSIGTNTDLQGNYAITMPQGANELVFSFIGMVTEMIEVNSSILNVSLSPDIQQLSEVVVTGYARERRSPSIQSKLQGQVAALDIEDAERMKSTTIKRQTNVEFEVDEPFTIKSGNPQTYIDLKKYEMEAEYHYVAIPKLDKSAYLMAGVANWDQYNLMDSEAKLFFEGSFVGTTILNANATIDTLTISLGNDKGIIIEREKIDDYNKSNFIGFNKNKQIGYEIMVRNSKSQKIDLTLYDQVPVSLRDDITVTVQELSKANYNKKTGELRWDLKLDAKSSVSKTFVYDVKYPKDEAIILE